LDVPHVHHNRRPLYPLDDRLGDLREIQPPGEVTGEAVEDLHDRETEAPEEQAPRTKIPVAVAPDEVDPAGKTPTTMVLVVVAPMAAANHPTMTTQATPLGHVGMEVTLHPHDALPPRQDTTGNS
jgi:hypothetical protein